MLALLIYPRNRGPTTYFDEDPHGVIGGGVERLELAAEIYHNFNDVIIYTTGYVETDKIKSDYAQVYKDYLHQVLNVRKDSIFKLNRADSTLAELYKIAKMQLKYPHKNIYIVANIWHLPRIQCLYNTFIIQKLDITQPKTQIGLIPAEYATSFHKVSKTGNYKFAALSLNYSKYLDRIISESKGICDIKSGKYKPKLWVV